MKKIFPALLSPLLLTLFISTNSCTKEEIIRSDTIIQIFRGDTITKIVNVDSMAVVKTMLAAKWLKQRDEIETYSGTTLVSKTYEYFDGINTWTDFKSNLTYTSFYKGSSVGGGTWELISPNYFVMDKGVAGQERYYFIRNLDKKVFVHRGPYTSDGKLFGNVLYDFYYTR